MCAGWKNAAGGRECVINLQSPKPGHPPLDATAPSTRLSQTLGTVFAYGKITQQALFPNDFKEFTLRFELVTGCPDWTLVPEPCM